MLYLVLGLVVFLGMHSLRIGGDARRDALRARLGEGRFKAAYSLLSVAGLLLVVYGFGVARETPEVLWTPPAGMRHLPRRCEHSQQAALLLSQRAEDGDATHSVYSIALPMSSTTFLASPNTIMVLSM